MVKRITVLAMLFVLLTVTPACAEWNDTTKSLFVAHSVLKLIDMRQTLDIAHLQGAYEVNPWLGEHPSDAKIYQYAAVSYALTWWLVGYLDSPWDVRLLSVYVGIQVGAVSNNYNAGLSIRF